MLTKRSHIFDTDPFELFGKRLDQLERSLFSSLGKRKRESTSKQSELPSTSLSMMNTTTTRLPIDIRELDDRFEITADLPGLSKDQVQIEIDDSTRTMTLQGEYKNDRETDESKWHLSERSVGSFMREFTLPENANLKDATARMLNGVLYVDVPKNEERKSKRRRLEVGDHKASQRTAKKK